MRSRHVSPYDPAPCSEFLSDEYLISEVPFTMVWLEAAHLSLLVWIGLAV